MSATDDHLPFVVAVLTALSVSQAAIGFGIVFETPVLAFILGRLGVITADQLMGAGRYAVIGIFIVSAILTPPDILTQFLMAGPLLILYGLSIVIVKYTNPGEEE